MESSEKSHGSRLRKWGLQLGIVLLAALWLALIATSWAESAEPESLATTATPVVNRSPAAAKAETPPSPSEDDEYNFSWLDPDKKVYVLQNRRYTKANKVVLSLMGGIGLSNTYETARNLDVRAAYYFSEAFGLEFFYTATFNTGNNALSAVQGAIPNISPVIRDIKGEYGLLLQWVPWYAKINVFNKILYFDWYFDGGLGGMQSSVTPPQGVGAPTQSAVNQSNFAGYLGTGHEYHLSENWLIRLDLTTAIYKAQTYGTFGDSSWYTNFNFGIGVGLKL